MIFVYTNKEDTHPTNVIKYLTEWGVPVFRFNTECLLTDYEFSWTSINGHCDFTIKNIKNGLSVKGSEITVMWERRAMIPKELPYRHQQDEINNHNIEEAHGFLSFLRYYMKDIPSIGGIVEDRYSESKMLQQAVAQQLGMRTPDTCFSNDAAAVKEFAKKYQTLSLKPISGNCIYVDDTHEYDFYSQKIESSQLMPQPEIAFTQTVNYLQEYIEKAYELRVTVIRDDVIACKIDSQSQDADTGKNDWRQGYGHNLKQTIVDIPDEVKQFCHEYMKRLHLNMGCFDFIYTPDNEYVFLECNPNGQWLWIELDTGYDISKVVAQNLMSFETVRR